MSRVVEGLDAGHVVEVARRVVDHHDDGGTCQRCTSDGCDEPAWARRILADAARDPAAFRQRVATW